MVLLGNIGVLATKLFASWDMNFDGVIDFAAEMFNSLWQIYKVPLGIVLAFSILGAVYMLIKDSFKGLGHG
jgi:hypothetical protein